MAYSPAQSVAPPPLKRKDDDDDDADDVDDADDDYDDDDDMITITVILFFQHGLASMTPKTLLTRCRTAAVIRRLLNYSKV